MKRMFLVPLMLAPIFAQAQDRPAAEIDYGYFQVSYLDYSSDVPGSGDLDGSGFSLDGSIELREHIHAFATFRHAELDVTPDDSVGIRWGGLGTHWQVADRLSVFGRLGFLNGDGDDGYIASGGVRYVPADGWEIRGGFRHFGWDVSDTDTGAFVEGDLWLTDIVALTFFLESLDAADTMGVAMRFYFGN